MEPIKRPVFSDSYDEVDEHFFAPILSGEGGNHEGEEEGELDVAIKNRTERPPLYKVLLHNDDYTTMEFVVEILRTIFGMGMEQAHAVMFKVHNEGFGVCGVYTFEIAETKVAKVTQMARDEGHPLKCTMEEE